MSANLAGFEPFSFLPLTIIPIKKIRTSGVERKNGRFYRTFLFRFCQQLYCCQKISGKYELPEFAEQITGIPVQRWTYFAFHSTDESGNFSFQRVTVFNFCAGGWDLSSALGFPAVEMIRPFKKSPLQKVGLVHYHHRHHHCHRHHRHH